MNKAELKKALKPLIKECVKEVIFEDGTLSTLVSEVVKGLGNPLTESRLPPSNNFQLETNEQASQRREKTMAKRKSLMESVGKDAYNGVNLFEGTSPAPAPQQQGQGPLSGVDPHDPGVDLSAFSGAKSNWRKLVGN